MAGETPTLEHFAETVRRVKGQTAGGWEVRLYYYCGQEGRERRACDKGNKWRHCAVMGPSTVITGEQW